MSEGIATSEITVHSQSQADVEALVQAAVSVLTNDMQVSLPLQYTAESENECLVDFVTLMVIDVICQNFIL